MQKSFGIGVAGVKDPSTIAKEYEGMYLLEA